MISCSLIIQSHRKCKEVPKAQPAWHQGNLDFSLFHMEQTLVCRIKNGGCGLPGNILDGFNSCGARRMMMDLPHAAKKLGFLLSLIK